MKKNKKLLLGLSISLAVVMTFVGTFAWFTAKDSVTNHFETDQITDGSVSILEVFTPPTDWKPGQNVTKQVAVANNGSGDVLVRLSFEEMMELLKMPAKSFDAQATGTQVPQSFNTAAYSGSEWLDTGVFSAVEGKPGNVTVKVKKVVSNAGKSNEKTSYSFVAFSDITTGTYSGTAQRVTASFEVDGTTLKMSDVKYWAFEGVNKSEAAWADFTAPQTSAAPTLLTKDKIENPITDPNNKLSLIYSDKTNLIAAAPQAGKWWYNEADGFFYYIGVLKAGTVSPNILESLKLDETADETYSGMKFDLIVNMEAIQNTEDAIRAATGWGLEGNDTLVNALKPYCA